MSNPDLERMSIIVEPEQREPKFGAGTMVLIAGGAVLIAGLFIFFVGYGLAYM